MSIDYEEKGDVAIIAFNNPPLNALGLDIRRTLGELIDRANASKFVRCIVLYGKGRTFPTSGDVQEDPMSAESERYTLDVVEGSGKPVVASIHGNCRSAGLELAMCAHYRIAHTKTRFGFQEVELGRIPGWRGTQRFPRLTSLAAAYEYIPTAKVFDATAALKIGAIDKVVSGDALKEGVAFARSIASDPLTGHVTSKRKVVDAHMADRLTEAALHKAKTRRKGQQAPVMCIKAIRASTEGTFADGWAAERQIAQVVFSSGQMYAMSYAYLTTFQASLALLPDGRSVRRVKTPPLTSCGVIGAGTMGSGIAMAMLTAGMDVVLVEQNPAALEAGVKTIQKLMSGSVQLRQLTEETAKDCMSRLRPSVRYEDLKDVNLVVEAVYENMDVKKQVFRQLEAVCKPSACLCTNTSFLSIDEIASVTSHPERVIGTHFFVPAYYMKLLEVVKGSKTSPDSIIAAYSFASKLKKIPALVGNCDGFVGNRMFSLYVMEAQFLVEEGALPHEVDRVLEDFGFPMGAFKVHDLSGLDISGRRYLDVYGSKVSKFDVNLTSIEGVRFCPLSHMLFEQGRLGRKTGKGWYRYNKPGDKVPYVDKDLSDFISQFSRQRGIKRRRISPQEILERCLFSMINEGFKILEENIAATPQVIDTVLLVGYGWPSHMGGPMYYAQQVGLHRLLDRICFYQKQHPSVPHWRPSQLLTTLAKNKTPFTEWATQTPGSKL